MGVERKDPDVEHGNDGPTSINPRVVRREYGRHTRKSRGDAREGRDQGKGTRERALRGARRAWRTMAFAVTFLASPKGAVVVRDSPVTLVWWRDQRVRPLETR